MAMPTVPDDRGLLGQPSPTIGEVGHVYTDATPDGTRRFDDHVGTRSAVAFAGMLFPGLVYAFFLFAAFAGVALGLDTFEILESNPSAYGLAGAVGAAVGLAVGARAALKDDDTTPMTVFVGTEGVERFEGAGGEVEHTLVRFADTVLLRKAVALSVGVKFTRSQREVNYKYAQSYETLRLVDLQGNQRMTVGVQFDARNPDASQSLLDLNAAVMEAASHAAMTRATEALSRGERLRFHCFHTAEGEDAFQPYQQLELALGELTRVAPQARADLRRQTFTPAELQLRVGRGRLTLETSAPGVNHSYDVSTIGDLLVLLQTARAAGFRVD